MRAEALLVSLIGLAVFLAIGVVVLVLPIIALARTRRIGDLVRRVAALESELGRLRRGESVAQPAVQPAPVTLQPAIPHAPPSAEAIPEVHEVSRPAPAFNIETWIGGRVLGWIAVVLLLFAGGFFLRHVINEGLIDELGRVAIGLLVGLGLCAAGLRFHQRGWGIFAQFLTAGGIVLLYLSTFASMSYYHLLAREHAAIFLVLIIIEGAALALLYESPAIAIMAVVGGLLNPVLLRSDHDQYVSLFTYLLVLNAGFLGLTLFRAWPAVGTVALVGSNGLFWLWFAANYHPEKRAAALSFHAILFALYLGFAVLINWWRQRRAGVEDLVRLTLNAVCVAVALFVLADPDYVDWRGTVAMGLAVVFTLFALLIGGGQPRDERQLFVAVAVAMALVATAFAWEGEAAGIALGWAVQGVVLWWFGLRIASGPLQALGTAFLLLAVGRLLLVDTIDAHPVPFVPIFNKYGLPATLIALSLLAAALITFRLAGDRQEVYQAATRTFGLGGVVLLWFVLSLEGYGYFQAKSNALRFPDVPMWEQKDGVGDPVLQRAMEHDRAYQQFTAQQEQLRRGAQTTLSVLWAVFALVTLVVGFRLPSRPLRWLALGLFGLTLFKVAFIDTAELRELYRVAVFLALSVMMALGAWGYQKAVRTKLLAAPNSEAPHEMA